MEEIEAKNVYSEKEKEDTMKNPFTPSFGQIPCQIAGRKDVMTELDYAFDNAPGDPSLTSVFVGARGTGKTALLTYYAKEMAGEGWISVNVFCLPGMMEDIYLQTMRNAAHLLDVESTTNITATVKAAVAGFGGELKLEKEKKEALSNWRTRMTDLIQKLNAIGTGLLITIDEINPKEPEMTQFIAVYQMWIREERKVALLMAGLPNNVSSLISSGDISFLRRASQYEFPMIPEYEVADCFRHTIEIGGKSIGDEALDIATEAIGGFPFMLQLVGYRAFMHAGENAEVSAEDVTEGIRMAVRDLKYRVLKPTLDEVSDMGISFLRAMAEDEESSLMTDIAERLGKTASYVSTYRGRLIAQGVIEARGRNQVVYALPFLREFLSEYGR